MMQHMATAAYHWTPHAKTT